MHPPIRSLRCADGGEFGSKSHQKMSLANKKKSLPVNEFTLQCHERVIERGIGYHWHVLLLFPNGSVIFLLGITGNVLVILTLVQNSRMRTVTNLFLVRPCRWYFPADLMTFWIFSAQLNLAISDLSLGVFCMPFTLVGALLRDFIFGQVFCKLIPFLQGKTIPRARSFR